jgi:hypothetical protein
MLLCYLVETDERSIADGLEDIFEDLGHSRAVRRNKGRELNNKARGLARLVFCTLGAFRNLALRLGDWI